MCHVSNISHSQLPQTVSCRPSLLAAACPPDPGAGQHSSCPPQSKVGIGQRLRQTKSREDPVVSYR